jgi:hypothetical protein
VGCAENANFYRHCTLTLIGMNPEFQRELRETEEWRAKKAAAPVVTQNLVSKLNDLVAELNENSMTLGVQTERVENAVRDLDTTLTAFHASSERSARLMVWLTAAILLLTGAIVALAVVTAL